MSKGKTRAQGSSLRFSVQAAHHIPASEVIEISDSDEPDSSQFTGINQPSTSLATRMEVIEILSSDGEDTPQSPLAQPLPLPSTSQVLPERSRQSAHTEGGMDLVDLPVTPPQSSFPPPPQLLEVSPPCEVEDMMSLSSPPIIPANPSQALESVEDSEPEREMEMDDTQAVDDPQAASVSPVLNSIILNPRSDDEPPSSSSSPSHHTPFSRHPSPIVRCLLYGGPNGIFKAANASILQHLQLAPPQDILSAPLPSPLDTHPDVERQIQLPPVVDSTPHIPKPLASPVSGLCSLTLNH